MRGRVRPIDVGERRGPLLALLRLTLITAITVLAFAFVFAIVVVAVTKE
ncbi:MAG: hypothetical protein IT384_33575 [Deltaproteobacteria bacterium]|nr:hypothetical protein [Deltaproteobacteria bacterium]